MQPFVNPKTPSDEPLIVKQARALLSEEQDRVANAANLSALIFHELDQLNWVGFYFLQGDELVLGPFQGQPACVRIALGRGVCGTAAAQRQTQRVADVHAFDGHIACDAASMSEIVVPLIVDESVIGVLDIDSPIIDRFSAHDQRLIEQLAAIYTESISARN
ncbi:MAG: GAF domain-containing protein [Pseudomonadota bacterium]